MSAFVDAARRGDLKSLQSLAKEPQFDINQTEQRTGFTALHAAAAWQNNATLHWLASETKIDPSIQDKAGRRALDIAGEGSNEKALQLLSEATHAKVFSKEGHGVELEAPMLKKTSMQSRTRNTSPKSRER